MIKRENTNERVFYRGGAPSGQSTEILQGLLLNLSSFPLFVSFLRINNYSRDYQNNAYSGDDNSPHEGELLEKITCQPDNDYCLAKISNGFGNKLYFLFRCLHAGKLYHRSRTVSTVV